MSRMLRREVLPFVRRPLSFVVVVIVIVITVV
jgi:hypothetical protein